MRGIRLVGPVRRRSQPEAGRAAHSGVPVITTKPSQPPSFWRAASARSWSRTPRNARARRLVAQAAAVDRPEVGGRAGARLDRGPVDDEAISAGCSFAERVPPARERLRDVGAGRDEVRVLLADADRDPLSAGLERLPQGLRRGRRSRRLGGRGRSGVGVACARAAARALLAAAAGDGQREEPAADGDARERIGGDAVLDRGDLFLLRDAEGGAAAAGRDDVRVVDLEAGALQALDVVDDRALDVGQARACRRGCAGRGPRRPRRRRAASRTRARTGSRSSRHRGRRRAGRRSGCRRSGRPGTPGPSRRPFR